MSLYENTEELFGGFEENDYLCIRYLTYWNKAERRRLEVSKPLPIKVLLVCKWLIIKGVIIRLADTSGIERMTQTIVYILIVINVITFLVYGIDKWKAKQGSWRISEAILGNRHTAQTSARRRQRTILQDWEILSGAPSDWPHLLWQVLKDCLFGDKRDILKEW